MTGKTLAGIALAALAFAPVSVLAEQIVPKRIHEVPVGWSDDMAAVMAKAKAENKYVFAYFPMPYDQIVCGMAGKEEKYSSIRVSTNPTMTKELSKDFALAFFPWEHYPVPDAWRKAHDYTRGIIPMYLVMTADGESMWQGNPFVGTWDIDVRGWRAEDFENKRGLVFVTNAWPRLKAVLPKLMKIRAQEENVTDEQVKAKMFYEVFKDLDPKFVQDHFPDDVKMMVKADKDGKLGIREKYPRYWLVVPLVAVGWDLWNERESRIRDLCGKDGKLSRKEAARLATMAMKEEWKPKLEKLLKVAKCAEGKLTGTDLARVKDLEDEAEKHLEFWDLKTTELPCF